MIEILDLEDLLASKGWQWLEDQYRLRWDGEQFIGRLEALAKNTSLPPDKLKAEQELLWQQRIAARGFLDLPKQEISTQRRKLALQSPSESRRGPGL